MTETTVELSRGDEYVASYRGGPYDGQTDILISRDGTWEESLKVLAAFDGKETQFDYEFVEAKRIGGKVWVTYVWDPAESEPVESPEDRNDH